MPCEDVGDLLGRGYYPCRGLGRRREESCPAAPCSALWGARSLRRRPQPRRDPELSTVRGQSRLFRRRQELPLVVEAAPWLREASGSRNLGEPCSFPLLRLRRELGRQKILRRENWILPGVAVCWNELGSFGPQGFLSDTLLSLRKQVGSLLLSFEACLYP